MFSDAARPVYSVGLEHPLYESHVAVIRTKFKTAVLAGRPPPVFPGNRPIDKDQRRIWLDDMMYYSKYIMGLFLPWNGVSDSSFPFNPGGFLSLLDQWDKKGASFINKGRVNYISNIISKSYRSSSNESTSAAWRERNVDYWVEFNRKDSCGKKPSVFVSENDRGDEETSAVSSSEVYRIAVSASCSKQKPMKLSYSSISDGYKSLLGQNSLQQSSCYKSEPFQAPLIYHHDTSGLQGTGNQLMSLKEMGKRIYNMNIPEVEELPDESSAGVCRTSCCQSNDNGIVQNDNMSEDQKAVLNELMDCSKQHLIFMHGGGGTGKTTVVVRLVEDLRQQGRICTCTCPTGVGATHLPQGRTFHSVFQTFNVDLNASNTITDMRRKLGGDRLQILMIDEVSMFPSKFLILLDKRLRSMYKNTVMFGGISILLCGDFLQIPVGMGGRDLFSVMYGKVNGEESTARHLFKQFKIFEMKKQLRAAKCPLHRSVLKSFRSLPSKYPSGNRWSKDDNASYCPISEDIISAVTKELSPEEVLQDPNWITKSTCLTTSNVDRCVINATAAKTFSFWSKKTALCWRRPLRRDYPVSVQSILYNEEMYPQLFGYYVQGAPGMILDNCSGNVKYGIANGTPCTMVSLVWEDKLQEEKCLSDIQNHCVSGCVKLSFAPDYIIVSVTPSISIPWPQSLNLSRNPGEIHIPIGYAARSGKDKYNVRLCDGLKVPYIPHNVDLAFALTAWKCQGGTFDYIIALLEHSPGSSPITFELLYVMTSRVREAKFFRCLPLSPLYNKNKLRQLRPNIQATKWRMDIGKDGYWKGSHLTVVEDEKKAKKRQHSVDSCATKKNRKNVEPRQENVTQQEQQVPRNVQPRQENVPQQEKQVSRNEDVVNIDDHLVTMLRNQHTANRLPILIRQSDYNDDMTQENREHLLPNGWLDDAVVDMFSRFAVGDDDRIQHYRIFLYSMYVLNNGHVPIFSRMVRNQPEVINKGMWLCSLCTGNHFQLLCIIRPCTPSCRMFIMDSLGFPTNFGSVQGFGRTLLNEAWRAIHGCILPFLPVNLEYLLVPRQTNGNDCGVYTIINTVKSVEYYSILLALQPLEIIDVTQWYTAAYATQYRSTLLCQFDEMVEEEETMVHTITQ